MSRAKLRFLLAALVFIAWIGYLAYLVAVTRDYTVLSRPQFLVSNLYVVAKVDGDQDHPAGSIIVEEMPWSADEADKKSLNTTLLVAKLELCHAANGWGGPGSYILPLMKLDGGKYVLAETPPSPGFHGRDEYRLRIYPVTDETRHQLNEIISKRTTF